MKTKGTNAWEQYIEYAVLLVAVAVMGWFAWGAFGTTLQVREGKRVLSASTVDEELLNAAKQLESKLRDGSPSPIEITAPAPMGSSFSNQLTSSVSPSGRVVFPTLDMMGDIDSGQGVQSELRMYVVPEMNAPSDIRTHQWYGTISESEIGSVENLENKISGPPHDTTWVQVAAKFDIDAVVESFASATDDLDAIPAQWYEDGADVFDIQIERQVLEGDTWSVSETVSALPGHLSYREKLAEGDVDALERDAIVHTLRNGEQAKIVTPDFFHLKGAKPKGLKTPELWDGEENVDDTTEAGKLKAKLKKTQRRISSQVKKIADIQERIEEEKKGGGGAPLGGGGRGGGSGKLQRLEEQLIRESDVLAGLLEDKQGLEDEITALLGGPSEETETIMTGNVWVWGHDMSVEPGKTYRYRMTLQIANPFFGHKPSLYEEQKTLAQSVTIPTATSPWTSNVEVQQSQQWFVVDSKMADEGLSPSPSDRGYVVLESFEFSDGEWISKDSTIFVGQPIDQGVPDETDGWFVLDVNADSLGYVVLLQNVETGEVVEKRPEFESKRNDLRQLQQQVRSQVDSEGEDSETGDPVMPPTGPRGGGGGGAGNPGSF
ncbi:MAG: hypothetical protein CMJ26_02950 [Phycisphaerae bacterium]|nr:hypothetical protein [Phycisphaerae bacterium]